MTKKKNIKEFARKKMNSLVSEKQKELIIQKEIKALNLLSEIWKCEFTYIGADIFSKIDGIFTRDNVIKGIFDVKVRNQSLSWYQDYKSVMINFNRIQGASEFSRLFKVKFFYIIQTSEGHLLVYQITNEEGNIVCPMNIGYAKHKVIKKGIEKSQEFKKQTAKAYLPLEENDYLTIYKHKGIGY